MSHFVQVLKKLSTNVCNEQGNRNLMKAGNQ